LLHPVNAQVDPKDQGLRVVWREKSFGQRLRFGARGGKSVPLGPRTIFLGRPKRQLHLLIIRKSRKILVTGFKVSAFYK